MSIINLLTLLVLIVYVTIWRHYLTGVIVVAILSVIEVFTYGMKHAMYLWVQRDFYAETNAFCC